MQPSVILPFESVEALERWLEIHHARERELWVRIFKKATTTPSVTWENCVVAALAWGWIDGQRRSHDEVSFLLRLTPRRPRSNWSSRNREHAERLIAEGRMRPPGLAHVEAAREDGRWERTYAGSADMVIPTDFIEALHSDPAALRRYEKLGRRDRFGIYYGLQTAKSEQVRKRRIAALVAKLAREEAADVTVSPRARSSTK